MKKWKVWVIGITTFLVIGTLVIGTYLFVQKSMSDLEAQKNDKESPTLETQNVTINKGELYTVKDFVISCEDNLSKECIIEFKEKKMSDYKEPGEYEIIVQALDDNGNETLKNVKLIIQGDEQILDSSEQSETGIPTVTETVSEESIETRTIYGTTCEYKITINYNMYTDGSKEEIGRNEALINCDYTTYHATIEELLPEAKEQMDTHSKEISDALALFIQKRIEAGYSSLTIDPVLISAAECRALEIGYSNNFAMLDDSVVLQELQTVYDTGGIEFSAPDITDHVTLVDSLLQANEFTAYFYNNDFEKIGVGLVIVHNQYIWVIYLN